jgi:hypothetical protein
MSNLTDLVPPLELCKKIPAGEFADSKLVWREDWSINLISPEYAEILPYRIAERGECFVFTERPSKDEINEVRRMFHPFIPPIVRSFFPAPTLQEIMKELPASNIYRIRHMWTANFINDSIDNGIKSTNPATAALKLWLKLKGIEHEQ